MKLYELAHSRTGDKGNISNVSLIAYDRADYEMLKEKTGAIFVNGKIIHISEKTKTFYDLMLNNINHKDKLKNLVNKFFLNTNIKK